MRLGILFAAVLLASSLQSASAEVLAVCGGSAGYSQAALSTASVQPEGAVTMPLALWRDAKGFDLLLNWGKGNQQSLRAAGADIVGNELGSQLIHLVVIRPDSRGLEHFLFSFGNETAGELIWNSPSAAAADDAASYETTCTKAN
jgi:hypothetical protein